jgi:lipopolysaccharide/colanic/teichoic acid biosynthesis glycosyltransferase
MPRAIKRGADVVAAAVLLVLLLPLGMVIAAAILCTMGRPLWFRQVRSGRHGVPFTLVKFRTMLEAGDALGPRIGDARRLTALGRFLRAWSLDELPQLWNVLGGEMSLVGPRPLLLKYLDRYSPLQRRRLEATPGITGWAQVNGRNALAWEPRFRLDVWYVDHWSLWLDFRILRLTLRCVLGRRGVTAGEHATMPEFQGSAPENPYREVRDSPHFIASGDS